VVLFADTAFADPRGSNLPHAIEIFTSDKHPLIDTDVKGAGSNLRGLKITVYKIDGIQSVERALSLNLPVEPRQAKQIALHRIQSLDEQTRSRMHAAATALAKAMQVGVDRYPAVVFDGEVVAYGVIDLTVALEQYRAWHTGRRP
jgi:integrating conjugative element protein (TIGR03757 family)